MSLGAEVVRIHPGRKRAIASNAHLLRDPEYERPPNVAKLSERRMDRFYERGLPVNTLLVALIETMSTEQYRLVSQNLRDRAKRGLSDRAEDALTWAALIWKCQR